MTGQKKNKLATGIGIGFAVGAMAGVIIGIASKDIALWLSLGVGAGLVFGAAAGLYMEQRKK